MAAMPCSRLPKWKLRPSGVSLLKSPMSLRFVLFDGARSAEPPIRLGTAFAIALSTCPPAARVARLSPSLKTGMEAFERSAVRAKQRSHSFALSGFSARQAAKLFFQSS